MSGSRMSKVNVTWAESEYLMALSYTAADHTRNIIAMNEREQHDYALHCGSCERYFENPRCPADLAVCVCVCV